MGDFKIEDLKETGLFIIIMFLSLLGCKVIIPIEDMSWLIVFMPILFAIGLGIIIGTLYYMVLYLPHITNRRSFVARILGFIGIVLFLYFTIL